jgi:endonuclease YncB( thermonuclease family)
MKPRPALSVLAVLGALLAGSSVAWPQAGDVSGTPSVIDGRTLSIKGRLFVLFGIEVPGPGQVCERRARAYPCGNVARTALMDLVAGATVTCRPVTGERARLAGRQPGGTVALCRATSTDLSWNMVHTGWALAEPTYGKRYYGAIEAAARQRRSGLWKGGFAKPWVWRAAQGRPRSRPGKKICVRGRLTGEGIECQALRGDDGKLYTLLGPKLTVKTGAPVCACGTLARFSTCMQGTTIVVDTLRQPEACPGPKK